MAYMIGEKVTGRKGARRKRITQKGKGGEETPLRSLTGGVVRTHATHAQASS